MQCSAISVPDRTRSPHISHAYDEHQAIADGDDDDHGQDTAGHAAGDEMFDLEISLAGL
jgi:hypothetical protein